MAVETTAYPLDYDVLKKGDVISVERLEEITKATRGTEAFLLKVLGLRAQIEREMEARDKPVTLKSVKGSLRILTDAEANEYQDVAFDNGIKKSRRAYKKRLQIVVANLTDEQKKRHMRSLLVKGHILQAISSTKKSLRLGFRVKQKAIEGNGVERTGPERTGPERTGPERTGPEWTEKEGAG